MRNARASIRNLRLPCKLTAEEHIARAMELAKAVTRQRETEDEKRLAVSGYREEIVSQTKRIRELSAVVAMGEEHREVAVEMEVDYKANSVRTRRVDTNEIIEERALSVDERQMSLDDIEELRHTMERPGGEPAPAPKKRGRKAKANGADQPAHPGRQKGRRARRAGGEARPEEGA